ncbi:axonemal dynein light intermediate polypeptide 1-like [Cimex lectularius]|uniref:Uncharacterized protein n=1 Tax=Cimex lectularius TaxID=79782 RepID=A0A8I6RUV4_CIMLE|nr:axonemal dynein light intermediate polypeptide 1-like [Cimex lectularius]
MYAGMIDLDELTPNRESWLKTEVNPGETLLKFTNPFIIKNVNAKMPPVKPLPKLKKEFKKSSSLLADTSDERQCVLDLISPPRMWTDKDGTTWMQQVSPQPTHRCQIQLLREKVDNLLVETGARDFGICPRRIIIFQQAFDEIIRQVTISCAERGLILLRVRDELKMTFTSYKLMFDDLLVYCDKKITPLEESLIPLEEEKQSLEKDIQKIKDDIDALNMLYDITQRRIAEKRHVENESHKDLVKAHIRTMLQLKKLIAVVSKPVPQGSEDEEEEVVKRLKVHKIPVPEEKALKIAHEEMRRKEKRIRRMKIKTCKVLRMKKMNEKLKKLFEKDLLIKMKTPKESAKKIDSVDDITQMNK